MYSSLPVEFGAFNKCVGVTISDEHFTAHTSEAFRMVLLLSSNLFIQESSMVKHNVCVHCTVLGNNIVFYNDSMTAVE